MHNVQHKNLTGSATGMQSSQRGPTPDSNTTSQASTANPSPAAPKTLDFFQQISDFFSSFSVSNKATSAVATTPTPLQQGNSSVSQSKTPVDGHKLLDELKQLEKRQAANNTELRKARMSLSACNTAGFRRYEMNAFIFGGGTDTKGIMPAAMARIDECTKLQKELERKNLELCCRLFPDRADLLSVADEIVGTKPALPRSIEECNMKLEQLHGYMTRYDSQLSEKGNKLEELASSYKLSFPVDEKRSAEYGRAKQKLEAEIETLHEGRGALIKQISDLSGRLAELESVKHN